MKTPAAVALMAACLLTGFAVGFAVAAHTSGRSQKAYSPDSAATTAEADLFLIAKENEVWEALKNKDKSADAQLLADDFVGLYDTGFGNKSEHVKQMDDSYTLEEYAIRDPRVLRLSPTMSLLLYESTCKATGDWVPYCSRPVYVSSLWTERDGRWLNLFSQDTQSDTYNSATAAQACAKEKATHESQNRNE